MTAVRTPTDWMDFADWDRYWSEVLASEFWTRANMRTLTFERTSLCHLENVANRQGHRILFAGNGISPEPYWFAHAGCGVTVVEVSAVACRFLASLDVTPRRLAQLFPVYDKSGPSVLSSLLGILGWTQLDLSLERSCARVAEEGRPGGQISIVVADLFGYEPEQPFDAIFSRRACQGLPPDRRQELAGRFYSWLRPGGAAFVQMHNIRDRQPFEEPFRSVGFLEVSGWSQPRDGEKQVLFWHTSG